ncbi:MAG: UbiA-like polyprenyltransferase [Candidatus Omnitrophota bacterium]|nr:UbiA-like polyprenyltransferase [Candidatus Omnitrophota bacterium]
MAAAVFRKVKAFLEMIKFEHSIFALPFAYLGLLIAEGGLPRGGVFLWVTIAMVSFRTLSMGANRIIDVEIDAKNPRTQNRALVQKTLSRRFALGATLLALVIFEYSAYRLGPLCFQLSPAPVLLTWLYPWCKRFTWFSHGVLGIIIGIAPYGAWIASRGELSWIPAFLMMGVATWIAGFDMIYALQDEAVDVRQGLYSVPSRFGIAMTLTVTRILHGATILFWLLGGWCAGLRGVYSAGVVIASVFLVREHWLVSRHGTAKINEAFFTMNAVVSMVIFLGATLDLYLSS